ncbi:hypothetical protein GCM10009557_55470 [Virgisporangium ochraceum]
MVTIPESPVVHRPVMYQSWLDLTFLHWRYPADVVQRLLPPGLTVQEFDGSAWIGLVPFTMSGVRFPGVPALPWMSRFPETNVRTYVTGPDGSQGIWFFSLGTGFRTCGRACGSRPRRAGSGTPPPAGGRVRAGRGVTRSWRGDRRSSRVRSNTS